MTTELRATLLASKLIEREAAAAALGEGWRVERLGDPFEVSPTFVSTYAARAAHVRALEGKNWQRLAASTEELAENLRSGVGAVVEWVTVKGFEEGHFVVLREVESGDVLGCMLVRPGGRAFELLKHPESYPGLALHAPVRVRLRIWRYPSFELFASWVILDAKGSFFLRRVLWDPMPAPRPEPTTHGSEVPFEAEEFRALISELQSIQVPPYVPSASAGLDGTRYGVAIADAMSSVRLEWWEENPADWAPLRDWHARAVAKLEARLS